jgi:diguanylate cyclase (GGDEF)-like protein
VQCRARLVDGRVVGVFRDVTFERMFLDELTEVAVRDALTGLLNRFAITDRLEHALERLRRQQRQVAVMFIDLDGLKAINDAHGHRRGDDVIRAVSARLLDAVRHEDSVGRYGGDEFVIVCEDIAAPEQAMTIAHRIVERLRLDSSEPGRGVQITTSVGVTVATKDDTAAGVLARADEAMYEAKRDGGGRVAVRR